MRAAVDLAADQVPAYSSALMCYTSAAASDIAMKPLVASWPTRPFAAGEVAQHPAGRVAMNRPRAWKTVSSWAPATLKNHWYGIYRHDC